MLSRRNLISLVQILSQQFNYIDKSFYQLIFINQKLMAERKSINVTFGDINQKNINILRKINFNALPVKYATNFYLKVAMQYTKFSKYCYYNDIVIGAYTTRIEQFKGQSHAYVLTIGVLEPYRKYGIGRKMMEQLENDIREKSDAVAIYLHMHIKNDIGKKFYERCGFKVEQRLDNYYTNLDEPHCYILRKFIRGDRQEAKQEETATTVGQN